MTSAESDKQDAINCFLDVLTGDQELATEIYDFTKTASMLKDVSPTFTNPSQSDIDAYAAEGRVVDVTPGQQPAGLGRLPGGERQRHRRMAPGRRHL